MQTPLELFAIASSSPGKREALWRNVRHQQESSENTLKRALLQSMPGNSGYDPGNARRPQIGIASSRERLCQSVKISAFADSLNKKQTYKHTNTKLQR